MISRRQFLKASAATAAVATVGGFLSPRRAHAFYQSSHIPLFKTTLRGVGPGGIPVAAPDSFAAPRTRVTHYTINIQQFTDQITPNLGPTTLWGYNPANPLGGGIQPQTHLGGIIVGQKGQPIQITFNNKLPIKKNSWGQIHPLPVDLSIPGAEKAQNRVATHLHGGLVPWISDGGPFDWFNPGTVHGDSFLNNLVLNPTAGPGQAEYYYPLNQSARFMWYHDHAVGITRLNAYAGIASGLLIRDNFENNLKNLGLPEYIEVSVLGGKTPHELPLVFQDKIFVKNHKIHSDDPTWTGATDPGSLWYAHTYEQARWDENVPGPAGMPPDPSSIPEFFGDTMLVNGTTYPEVPVEARRYRLRLLNACNARFLNLQLYEEDITSDNGITLNGNGFPTNRPFINAATGKPTWLQIGTEGGFLATPAQIPSNQPLVFRVPPDPITGQTDPSKVKKSLLVAPAERPDVIVDFSRYAGKNVILYSDAPAPFPGGDPVNDYFPGLNVTDNPVNGPTRDGFGPNTRVLMRFVVGPAQAPYDNKLLINENTPLFQGLDPFLLPPSIHFAPPFIKRRSLTLNEYHDEFGRLIQILGNDALPYGSPYFGNAIYADYPGQTTPIAVGHKEEHVKKGDVEVWEIYNTTGDVHPMHFHLVNVQVVNRQLFTGSAADPVLSGPIIPPDSNESGWKETVPMYPGTVTRVIMKFDLSQAQIVTADGGTIRTPSSPRTGGDEYVWHCHILEHEEHDMMHGLVVS